MSMMQEPEEWPTFSNVLETVGSLRDVSILSRCLEFCALVMLRHIIQSVIVEVFSFETFFLHNQSWSDFLKNVWLTKKNHLTKFICICLGIKLKKKNNKV